MSLEDKYSDEQIKNMAAMYDAILANPETREMGLRATKKINPKLAIAELDTKDAITAAVKPVQEELDKLVAERLKKEAEDRVFNARKALRDDGFSGADVEAIEKLMVSDGITTHASAAKFYKAQQQLALSTPGTMSRSTLNYTLPESPLKAIQGAGKKGLAAWARSEATAAVDAIRSGAIKLH